MALTGDKSWAGCQSKHAGAHQNIHIVRLCFQLLATWHAWAHFPVKVEHLLATHQFRQHTAVALVHQIKNMSSHPPVIATVEQINEEGNCVDDYATQIAPWQAVFWLLHAFLDLTNYLQIFKPYPRPRMESTKLDQY